MNAQPRPIADAAGRLSAYDWASVAKDLDTRGCAMLEALCRDEFASEAGHRGLLKHSCYSKPHNEGVDSATMFGDFFFAEALCRVALPGGLRPQGPVFVV